MALASPVDAGILTLRIAHVRYLTRNVEPPRSSSIPVLALGRQKVPARTPPRDVDRRQSFGAQVPPGGRATRGNRSLPRDWLGPGTLRLARVRLFSFRSAATHFMRTIETIPETAMKKVYRPACFLIAISVHGKNQRTGRRLQIQPDDVRRPSRQNWNPC